MEKGCDFSQVVKQVVISQRMLITNCSLHGARVLTPHPTIVDQDHYSDSGS